MASRYRTRQYTATVGTPEQPNPLKRSYVTLAQNADSLSHHEQSEPVVIGNRVSEKAVRRSGLLSGLAETEGLASLPARLSSDDIQLWEAAYVMNVDMSSEDLAAVLHVADVLEDGHTGHWVEILSKRVLSAKWADTQQASDVLCSLLQLPSHLLRRVLTACLATSALQDLLVMLPSILYPALIATCAASGSMTLPGSAGHLQMTLSQLAAASCPPPGLRSLRLPRSISKRAGSVTTRTPDR